MRLVTLIFFILLCGDPSVANSQEMPAELIESKPVEMKIDLGPPGNQPIPPPTGYVYQPETVRTGLPPQPKLSPSPLYSAPTAPSFDCKKARLIVESLICNDTELASLDRTMADTYWALRETMSPERRQQLKKEQLSWLAQRNACASRNDARRCIKELYLSRTTDLQDG